MPQVGRCASTSERPSAEAAGKDALPFPVPANEPERLAALRALNIVNSPPETSIR